MLKPLNNILLTRIGIVLLFCAITLVSKAQSGAELVEQYMQKQIDYITYGELVKQLSALPAGEVIAAFRPYTTDTLPRVRQSARSMIGKTGLRATNAGERKLAISILLEGLKDTQSGNINALSNLLAEFHPSDFTPEHRYIISQYIKQDPSPAYLHKFILLSGYLQIEELIYNYQQMLNDSVNYTPRMHWNMLLAMARMNNADAIRQVTRRIASFPLGDNVVYDIYPNLAYIRQKEAFKILFDAIMSDAKDCNSANPDNEAPIICAFRILGYVAPYIEGFPVQTDKYGEPLIDNYDKTLADVRAWITANRDSYTLITDKY